MEPSYQERQPQASSGMTLQPSIEKTQKQSDKEAEPMRLRGGGICGLLTCGLCTWCCCEVCD
uniref:Uncharacterized protein n=1 Tax=Kwoniella pini CBS 10737 TaxID=1296096 RepID=A0A1B9I7B3_9TREE|nr:uncharacterized protein I206_02154 [Kwoniella pini CBS 10737]OCF51440.1 hypothetical protein I206_02154 [Kwoniella pini CBS 10737]